MLNPTEIENSTAQKTKMQKIKDVKDMVFIMLINVKMPTINIDEHD